MKALPRQLGSMAEQNRETLISFFRRGIKPAHSPRRLGVEVEHFVVHADTFCGIAYKTTDGSPGVREILEHLSSFFEHRVLATDGELLGLVSQDAALSLEPAAQLEISIAPFERIEDVAAVYERFRKHLDPFLEECGYTLITEGYHPHDMAQDLSLIPKERYDLMDRYFSYRGTEGKRMMRASASTQVSIDYASEEDAIRKMRLAQALTPILGYISDNVTHFEGKPSSEPLERLNLWRNVDPLRCGSVPGLFEDGYGFAEYADWLLRTPPIYVIGGAETETGHPTLQAAFDRPAEEVFGEKAMNDADVDLLVSMFWPDVRLKSFVEIRPADSMPFDLVCGYTALIKGLFYADKAIEAIEEALGVKRGIWPFDDRSADKAIEDIRAGGAGAHFCSGTVESWADFLFETASRYLDDDEIEMLSHLEEFAASKCGNSRKP